MSSFFPSMSSSVIPLTPAKTSGFADPVLRRRLCWRDLRLRRSSLPLTAGEEGGGIGTPLPPPAPPDVVGDGA